MASGPFYAILKGNSMEPVILNGDPLIYIPVDKISSYKTFDIILFKNSSGNQVCHYYWSKSLNKGSIEHIQTRPLNPLDQYDFPIEKKHIIGKVINKKVPALLKLRIIASFIWSSLFRA